MNSKFFKASLALGLTLSFGAAGAHAAQWPEQPIRLVVPYAAGGPTDVIARQLGAKIGEELGQTVVVENKPGAGGTIGVDFVARAKADGYTFGLVAPGPLAGMPNLMKVPYDLDDINYVSLVGRIPAVIVVNKDSGIADLAALVKKAKAEPGELNYGSAGDGTTPNIGMELFKKEAGVDIMHIPYKGAAPAVTALLGGHVQVTMVDLLPVLPHVRDGKLTALAIAGKERAPQLPDLPTTVELGYENVLMDTNYGIIAPKGLPADIEQKFHQAVAVAVQSPEMQQQYANLGVVPVTSSGGEYRDLMKSEFEKWRTVVTEANIALK